MVLPLHMVPANPRRALGGLLIFQVLVLYPPRRRNPSRFSLKKIPSMARSDAAISGNLYDPSDKSGLFNFAKLPKLIPTRTVDRKMQRRSGLLLFSHTVINAQIVNITLGRRTNFGFANHLADISFCFSSGILLANRKHVRVQPPACKEHAIQRVSCYERT
jgi:hypothetical protein